MNFKSEKGSITVFVVASCMLFTIVALGISNFIQNKANNEEEQYREIKKSYEKDIGNEDEIYNRLKNNIYNEQVHFDDKEVYVLPTSERSVTINQKIRIVDNNLFVNNIEYKWYYKGNDESWNAIEGQWIPLSKQDKVYNVKKEYILEGIYALKIKINDEIYNDDYAHQIRVEEANISIDQSINTIQFANQLKYNYKVGIGETTELAKDNAGSVTVDNNNSFNYGNMTTNNFLYAEATDSYGNKVYISKNLVE